MNDKPRRILMAMGNMLGTLWGLFPACVHVWMALKAKYDGVQFSPIRFSSTVFLVFGLSNYVKHHIFAAEQSPRSEHLHWRELWPKKIFREILEHKQSKLAFIFQLLLPEIRKSFSYLLKLWKSLGRVIPMVVYPYHEERESQYRRFHCLPEKILQLEGSLLERWGVDNYKVFQARIYPIGGERYNGICWDTKHVRTLPWDWEEVIPKAIDDIRLVHVRFTSGLENKSQNGSVNELLDLFEGRFESELAEMILQLVKAGYEGDFVLEVPIDCWRVVLGRLWILKIQNPLTYIRLNSQLVQNLNKLISLVIVP